MKHISIAIILSFATVRLIAGEVKAGLVVHEWGTFTSVQGGDGKLLFWQPFTTPDLPTFVYDWNKPGLGRSTPATILLSKGGIRSLQRMETPVIYFYSKDEITADVEVRFPKGFITEWFPQADVDFKKPTTPTNSLEQGVIAWRNLKLLPTASSGLATLLPHDSSENHYYAARETDSTLIQIPYGGTNGTTTEWEKLLFYRGTGNFTTPLKVTVESDGRLSVANTGAAPIADLFLLEIQSHRAKWTQLRNLSPGQTKPWQKLTSPQEIAAINTDDFTLSLGQALEISLVRAGLFPKEAAAMVKTWKRSWFSEDGVRVLYILPREWTDQTLPLTVRPHPTQLERVMVGRAEIISPALQKEIATLLSPERSADPANAAALQKFRSQLGRFYGPAYQLASEHVSAANKPVAASSAN